MSPELSTVPPAELSTPVPPLAAYHYRSDVGITMFRAQCSVSDERTGTGYRVAVLDRLVDRCPGQRADHAADLQEPSGCPLWFYPGVI